MSKRRNENGQMRREEWEAGEDDGDIAGSSGAMQEGFERASDEAIRRRKIVTARPTGKKRATLAAPAAAPVAATTEGPPPKAANPFQGFQGLTAGNDAQSSKSNPFAGFSGLTTPSAPVVTAAPVAAARTTPISSSAKSTPGSYQVAIESLNKEFLVFVRQQHTANPASSWEAAVRDYLMHAEAIGAKFASSKPVPATRDHTTTVAKPSAFSFATPATSADSVPTPTVEKTAPAPTISSGFSFGSALNKETKSAPASASSGFSFGAASGKEANGFTMPAASEPKTSLDAPVTAKPASEKATDAAPKPAPSAGGFSFGSITGSTEKPSGTTTGGFAFGSAAPPASTPTSGFSFNLSKPASDAMAKPATSSSGFSFNLSGAAASTSTKPFSFGSSSTASTVPAPSGGAAAAEEEDEESVGREEATVILKSDNPDEETLFEVEKAKILEFKKDEKRWADKGTHPLKVLVNKETKNARILVRNEIGKIVINSALYKGLKASPHEAKGKKVGVLVTLQVEATLSQFILKVNSEKVEAFLQAIQDATPK